MASRSRFGWLVGVLAGVVVAAVVVVGVVWAWPSSDGEESCPPVQEATGVSEPVNGEVGAEEQDQLSVVEKGFEVYQADPLDTEDAMSFGFLLKNESDFVVYNANFQVELVDSSGDNILESLPDEVVYDNEDKTVANIPVILPGQEIGFGGDTTTWAKEGREEKPDYESVELEATLTEAEFWEPDNDRHAFVEMPVQDGEVVRSEEDNEFVDGRPATFNDVEYQVESPACQELGAYAPTILVRDAEGEIVGGAAPGDAESITSDGKPKGDRSYEPGLSKTNPAVGHVAAPGDDLAIDVYPYIAPMKPHVDD